jgi:adenosylcobinamide hydrolase
VLSGLDVTASAAGVVVRSATPLAVASSAVVGGGLARVRAIVNVHVEKHGSLADARRAADAFARAHGIDEPYVGLLTGARTERAEIETVRVDGLAATAVVTVGLSNRTTAGVSPPVATVRPATINTIVVIDADAPAAALLNVMMTVTEAKTLALVEAGVRAAEDRVATGTSTDAVVVAVTGRGPAQPFGGPVSMLGWTAAQAAGAALRRGIARWLAERAHG